MNGRTLSVRHLIIVGAVTSPPQLAYYQPPLLGAPEAAAGFDVSSLGAQAFSACSPMALQPGATSACVLPSHPRELVYNRAIGVNPAARPAKLSASEQLEAGAKQLTATTLRDLTLPD